MAKRNPGKFVSFMRQAAIPVCVGLNMFVSSVAVFSGFAGYIDQEYMPFAGIVGMTFPAWYLLCAILIPIDLLTWRRMTVIPVAAMLIAIKPMLTFCPLHFGKHEIADDEAERTFKVLSYNIVSFVDEEGLGTPDFNRTMHTILHSEADVVALLEYDNQGPMSKFVPQTQIDSLNAIYPYFSAGGRGTVLYSKRPIFHVTPPKHLFSRGSIEAFRTSVCGHPINVFAVHLESIGLVDADKELYRGLTDQIPDENTDYSQVRTQIIDKLCNAFRNRAVQAKMLRSYVSQLGGDAIVCGDFNDVPGCRTVRIMEEIGMKDAYAATACGPTKTFNAPRFPFRIDHVLWRGDFEAIDIERGNVASSDHYPMLTTFLWNR